MAEENEDILVSVDNGVGLLTLNRPKAINSLTHGMVTVLAGTLKNWENDDSVHTVLLTGAGERGLCAGGDIVDDLQQRSQATASRPDVLARRVPTNAQIARYPKPYVAVMDGIVMGGGVGVGAHAQRPDRHR